MNVGVPREFLISQSIPTALNSPEQTARGPLFPSSLSSYCGTLQRIHYPANWIHYKAAV